MNAEGIYSPLPPWQRTDYCGSLRGSDAGREVALWGWVASRRDHGKLIFVDLRDREGLLQLVFNPEQNSVAYETARNLRSEYFLAVKGQVVRRAEGTVNAQLPTGEIEVAVSEAEVLSASQPPPFPIDGDNATEEIRLKYRYLDLRRPEMQQNLRRRYVALRAIREYLDQQGFIEVETPILWKATPEGARDYLVPSRVNPGKFYALPQSPQLLKQLLMIGGFDRYFQIARCFRDEDLRANRQPEFTQIDIEMTCPRPTDIMTVIEGMYQAVWHRTLGVTIETPFPRLPYNEVMDRFGIDKPDLRFGLEMRNLTESFSGTGFKVFADVLSRGECIYGINLPAQFQLSRRELDELAETLRSQKGLGLAWAKVSEGGWQGPIARHLGEAERTRAAMAAGAQNGDTLLMVAGPRNKVRIALGELRLQLGRKFLMIREGEWRFLWVVDFPLFEFNDQDRTLSAVNHPFTAPHPDDVAMLEGDPLKVRSLGYDVVLNGEELASGSIRIHSRELQLKVFEMLGVTREEAMERFGFLIDALTYGAPPHGGIAPGVDRMIMLLCNTESIRDVVAFPKTQRAVDLMSGAPSEVDERQLRELSIKVVK
jgi:aspartyl-tRNA synthetase